MVDRNQISVFFIFGHLRLAFPFTDSRVAQAGSKWLKVERTQGALDSPGIPLHACVFWNGSVAFLILAALSKPTGQTFRVQQVAGGGPVVFKEFMHGRAIQYNTM